MPTVTITFNDPATILVTSPASDAPVSPASAPSTGEDPVASHPDTAASPAAVSGDRLEQQYGGGRMRSRTSLPLLHASGKSGQVMVSITDDSAIFEFDNPTCQRGSLVLPLVTLRSVVGRGERPWYDDPREIAALWRWLVSRSDQPGGSEAYFIENAHEWFEDRECMVREQGRVTSE